MRGVNSLNLVCRTNFSVCRYYSYRAFLGKRQTKSLSDTSSLHSHGSSDPSPKMEGNLDSHGRSPKLSEQRRQILYHHVMCRAIRSHDSIAIVDARSIVMERLSE